MLSNIRELSTYRVWLDQVIVEWSRSITESDLDYTLNYTSMKGAPADKSFYGLVMHFFNHQTHHRGQAHALITHFGARPEDTDLPFMPAPRDA